MTDHESALTVVVPVRDDADVVGDALASLLAQDGGPPGIVVVDDGSVDGSAETAREAAPSARLVRTAGLGPAAARNAGVAACTAELLAFCDADDTWPNGRCRRDLELLRARPDVPGLLGLARFEAETAELLAGYRFDGPEPVQRIWHLGALTVRRSTWQQVGALDESMRRFEDQDWFLRAHDAGIDLLHLDEVSLVRRLRVAGLTAGQRLPARDRLAFLHRTAVRRRSER